MKVVQVILMFCLMCVSVSHGKDIEEASSSDLLCDRLLTKLEYLQAKMEAMESTMKEADQKLQQVINQQNENEKRQDSIDQQLVGVSQAINKLYQETGQNFTSLHAQLNGLHTAQIATANHEEMRKGIQMLAYKQDVALLNIKPNLNLLDFSFSSCKKEPSKTTGKYFIQPSTNNVPFNGVCAQAAFGGGWLVFQYRFNGSVNFFRNWTEYRDGFGSLDGEFWLGLEHLHRLTSAKPHELLVELKDWNGTYTYAWYDRFEIADESEQYALKILGTYSGTAGEALDYHKGMKFTTMDKDNDRWPRNCAIYAKGAWWYNSCNYSNLNGLYKNDILSDDSMKWSSSNPWASHAYTRMSIREK